jgi:hypothetical protein
MNQTLNSLIIPYIKKKILMIIKRLKIKDKKNSFQG